MGKRNGDSISFARAWANAAKVASSEGNSKKTKKMVRIITTSSSKTKTNGFSKKVDFTPTSANSKELNSV